MIDKKPTSLYWKGRAYWDMLDYLFVEFISFIKKVKDSKEYHLESNRNVSKIPGILMSRYPARNSGMLNPSCSRNL
jgi:hypothetical protein